MSKFLHSAASYSNMGLFGEVTLMDSVILYLSNVKAFAEKPLSFGLLNTRFCLSVFRVISSHFMILECTEIESSSILPGSISRRE